MTSQWRWFWVVMTSSKSYNQLSSMLFSASSPSGNLIFFPSSPSPNPNKYYCIKFSLFVGYWCVVVNKDGFKFPGEASFGFYCYGSWKLPFASFIPANTTGHKQAVKQWSLLDLAKNEVVLSNSLWERLTNIWPQYKWMIAALVDLNFLWTPFFFKYIYLNFHKEL